MGETTQIMMNGEVHTIPIQSDGSISSDELRKLVGVPDNRVMILQNRDGSNLIVNPGENIQVHPGQHYQHAPLSVRGCFVQP